MYIFNNSAVVSENYGRLMIKSEADWRKISARDYISSSSTTKILIE